MIHKRPVDSGRDWSRLVDPRHVRHSKALKPRLHKSPFSAPPLLSTACATKHSVIAKPAPGEGRVRSVPQDNKKGCSV
jgi:hypothetical protein